MSFVDLFTSEKELIFMWCYLFTYYNVKEIDKGFKRPYFRPYDRNPNEPVSRTAGGGNTDSL